MHVRLHLPTRVLKEQLCEYLRTGAFPPGISRSARIAFLSRVRRLQIRPDGVLVFPHQQRSYEVIANDEHELISTIISRYHGPMGHYCRNTVWANIRQRYVGFSRQHVEDFIAWCEACQRNAAFATRPGMQNVRATMCWEHVQMDCVDLRTYADENDGYKWILVVIDIYSKYMHAYSLMDKSAASVVTAMRALFMDELAPAILQSDNGREFKNAAMRELCAEYNVALVHGRARYPQAQGQVERANQTLCRSLAKMVHGTGGHRWIDVLPAAVRGYNWHQHRATRKFPIHVFRARARLLQINASERAAELTEVVSSSDLTDESFSHYLESFGDSASVTEDNVEEALSNEPMRALMLGA